MNGKDNFFAAKRPWSVIKDRVLVAYLEPYLSKVSSMGNPIRIADTFAGKGRFDDGEPGSPTIICEAIRKQLAREDNKCKDIKGIFIEKKYATELTEVLQEHSSYSHILSGEYEDRMRFFLENYSARNTHFFFYVDPYGIKSLRFSHFDKLKQKSPQTIEVLLNMNAFGFMREGCHLLGINSVIDSEIPEYYYQDVDSVDRMNEIAGGKYWQDIVQDYYSTNLSMKEAEEIFVQQYRERMKTVFKFVIDIPIKTHLELIPKYRIIYGTDHEDGLLLMADNMHKRWDEFRVRDRGGMKPLFEIDFPDPNAFDCTMNLESQVMEQLSSNEMDLKDLLVRLIAMNGIAFSTSQYKQTLKGLASSGSIIIRRDPELTDKRRMRTGWDHMTENYTVYVSKAQTWQSSLL